MKAKNEEEFIMFRMLRRTHAKIKQLNGKRNEGKTSVETFYQTLDELVEEKLKTSK